MSAPYNPSSPFVVVDANGKVTVTKPPPMFRVINANRDRVVRIPVAQPERDYSILEDALFSNVDGNAKYRIVFLERWKASPWLSKRDILSHLWKEGLRVVNGKIIKKHPLNVYMD